MSLTTLALDRDKTVALPAPELSGLPRSVRDQLDRLVDVQFVSESTGVAYLRANRRYRVGRVVLDRYLVVVPPPMDPSSFVDFYIFSSGASLSGWREGQRTGGVSLTRFRGYDVFLELMGYRFASATEELIHRGIRRDYVRRCDRLRSLRGKPLWDRDFGRHPATGRTCRYYAFTVDTPLNRAIRTGVLAASRILRHHETLGILAGCRRSLSEIGTDAGLTEGRADDLRRRMTRLEEPYQIPLALAVAFARNASAGNLFAGGTGELPTVEFYLPDLFEGFVERCLREIFRGSGIEIHVQYRDRNAILDGFGDPYRAVRPDFVLFRSGVPVAVVDAKFKPQYLRRGADGSVPMRNRVTSQDIYQLSFYQAKLKSAYSLRAPPAAYIIAPLLNGAASAPRVERRQVRWVAESSAAYGFGLEVVALPIEDILNELRHGASIQSAMRRAPEIIRLVRSVNAEIH